MRYLSFMRFYSGRDNSRPHSQPSHKTSSSIAASTDTTSSTMASERLQSDGIHPILHNARRSLTRYVFLAVMITVISLLASCGDDPSADPPVWPNYACFQGGETPQLDLEAPVENWTWNDPHVLKVSPEYWMYASATELFDFPVRLYRLVSIHGSVWSLNPITPILDDAPPAP
jgi:hypothetical protein